MKLQGLSKIIERWQKEYTLVEGEDLWGESNNDGKETVKGVALPSSPDAKVIDEGGYHVAYDKDFYTLERLDKKDKVEIDGKEYEVWQEKNYAEYGDYYKYELRAVDGDD